MPWLDEAFEDELAAGQRRAERAALRRMLAFRLEEERCLPQTLTPPSARNAHRSRRSRSMA